LGFDSGVAENFVLGFSSWSPNEDPAGEKVDKRTLVERISIKTIFMWALELICLCGAGRSYAPHRKSNLLYYFLYSSA
jgi:hypothetical protein